MLEENAKNSVKDILKKRGLCVREIDFDILKGDASERSYYRIRPEVPGGETFILMKMKKGFNSCAEEITKSSMQIAELPFLNVRRYLESIGARVPGIIGVDESNALIVLEDLGDECLYSLIQNPDKNGIEWIYSRLVDELVKIQTAQKPHFPCIAFYRKYDRQMCRWELDHFTEWGIESLLEKKLGRKERKIIDGFYSGIVERFMKERFYFCHRDYHSKNVMVKDGDLILIDFQDALLAPRQYDLASLLRDSYASLDQAAVDCLIKRYLEGFPQEKGDKIDEGEFVKSFDFISVHRNLKAAGRFVFIDKKKNNPAYLRYIPHTLDNVRKNLKKYEEFKDAKNLLCEHIDMICERIGSQRER